MQRANVGFVKQFLGVYSVFNSVNYQSTLSNLVSLAPPPKLYLYLRYEIQTIWINTWEFFQRRCLFALWRANELCL